VEVLLGDRHGAISVGRVVQDWERRLDLAERKRLHALDGRPVDGHPGRAVAGVEQELHEGSAEGVAHDDRLRVECVDDLGEVIEDLTHAQVRQGRGIVSDRLDTGCARLDSRIAGRDNPQASLFVAGDPMLPRQRRHPKAVDEYDCVSCFWFHLPPDPLRCGGPHLRRQFADLMQRIRTTEKVK